MSTKNVFDSLPVCCYWSRCLKENKFSCSQEKTSFLFMRLHCQVARRQIRKVLLNWKCTHGKRSTQTNFMKTSCKKIHVSFSVVFWTTKKRNFEGQDFVVLLSSLCVTEFLSVVSPRWQMQVLSQESRIRKYFGILLFQLCSYILCWYSHQH